MKRGIRTACATMAATIAALCATSATAASIVAMTPQGEVAQVRQVVVKFSESVIAFGDPRVADPATVTCQGSVAAGSGRWADDRVWLYDFREPLGPGARCVVAIRADWKPAPKAAAGAASATGATSAASLTGKTQFTFSTGGPAVVSMQPGGGEIEEDQHFLMRLSGAAVEASVVANAWCEVEGIGERLQLRIVTGAVRDEILKARNVAKAQADKTLVAHCERPLPNGSAVRFIWGKGIEASANAKVVTTVEQRFRYTVRAAFTAEFTCERQRANAPCLPIRPMSVRFTAPIAREAAAQLRLRRASGEAMAPVFDKDDTATEVSEVAFPKPLAENASFIIEMPAGLKDGAGRPLANASAFPLKVQTGSAPPIAKFAAAPFGIIERFAERSADAMLPVTLRHVQPDLRAAAGTDGQVRVKRLQSDADILAWYAKLQKYHETQMTAKSLGLPEREWYTFEDETKPNGKVVKHRVENNVGTREISLLAKEPGARRLDLPQIEGGDPRPFEVVGIPLAEPGYHVVEIESLRLGSRCSTSARRCSFAPACSSPTSACTSSSAARTASSG